MPVADLVDVPEDDFVFSFHVVGDAFFLDPLHEALQDHKWSMGLTAINEASLRKTWTFHLCGHFLNLWLLLLKYTFSSLILSLISVHLHHDAEIFDVIFLCLNQLIENKPEQDERPHECAGGKSLGDGAATVTLTFFPSSLWLSAPARGFGVGRGLSALEGRER